MSDLGIERAQAAQTGRPGYPSRRSNTASFGHPRRLRRGLAGVQVEIGIAAMAYNLKGIVNVLGATNPERNSLVQTASSGDVRAPRDRTAGATVSTWVVGASFLGARDLIRDSRGDCVFVRARPFRAGAPAEDGFLHQLE